MTRHAFSGSRANRDRRDASYARAVIARATKMHNEEVAREAEADARDAIPEKGRCIYCNELLVNKMHDPYCTTYCSVMAEVD